MFTTILRKSFCYHILDGKREVARKEGEEPGLKPQDHPAPLLLWNAASVSSPYIYLACSEYKLESPLDFKNPQYSRLVNV